MGRGEGSNWFVWSLKQLFCALGVGPFEASGIYFYVNMYEVAGNRGQVYAETVRFAFQALHQNAYVHSVLQYLSLSSCFWKLIDGFVACSSSKELRAVCVVLLSSDLFSQQPCSKVNQ